MYLYCICYIALVILAGLTVFRHRWNGTQILFSPFNVDRTLSLRGILVLLIVLHHLSGVTSFPGLSPSFRMLVSQFTFFGGGAVSMFFFSSFSATAIDSVTTSFLISRIAASRSLAISAWAISFSLAIWERIASS